MFGAGIDIPLSFTASLLPKVYDPVLYHITYILDLSNILPFFTIVHSSKDFLSFLFTLYNFVIVIVVAAASSEFMFAKKLQNAGLLLRFLVAGVIGYFLYYLMPALSPFFYFGLAFPNHLPDYQSVPSFAVAAPTWAVLAPHNAMPSLHATWAILIFLTLRHSPLSHRILGGLFVLSTFLITIGTGFHYIVDWIVAAPLVLLVRGICATTVPLQNPTRRNAIYFGAVLLLFWVLAVRGSPESLSYPSLIRMLALTSASLPFWLEYQLEKAEDTLPMIAATAQLSATAPITR